MSQTAGEEQPQARGAELSREWRRWAAISLLGGTPLVDVLAILQREGFDEAGSVQFCASLYDHPAFEAGQWMAEQVHKTQSVLTMRDRMRSLSDRPVDIDRRCGLSGTEFLDQYYSQNTPVVLTDVCDRWAARSSWSPSYLRDKLGGVEVEVMSGREADAKYEINANDHKYLMPFDEYVAKVEATERGNDIYLVANNKLLATPAARVLWDDFELDERYLAGDPGHSRAFLWFGPAGTITPLHHDTVNVMFNQVDGWKHFTLIPSLQIHRMYNNIAVYSEVDAMAPDLEQYPLYAGVTQIHLDVGPGETLFIPAGWWHHVESLEASISISFTNFAFSNDIEWANPTLAP